MHILHKKQPLSVITLISEKDCLTPNIRYLLITDKLLCSLSVKILLLQVSGYVDSAGRCMGKRVCHAAAVSDNKETLVAGFQIFVDLKCKSCERNGSKNA